MPRISKNGIFSELSTDLILNYDSAVNRGSWAWIMNMPHAMND